MSPPTHVHCDFETYSEVPLKKAGAYRYMTDPSTRVLCMSWRYRGMNDVHRWFPGDELPEWVNRRDVIIWGWNVYFEYLVFKHQLKISHLGLSRFRCSMALAAYCGYPLDLARASRAVGVEHKSATNIMRRCCTPQKTPPTEAELAALYDYCDQDVRAEESVWAAMPVPELPGLEQNLWALTQHMSDHGVRVDVELLCKLRSLAEVASHDLTIEMVDLIGLKPTQTAKLAGYFGMGSIAKDDLEAALRTEEDPTRRRAMEIRLEAGKSSVAKLEAMQITRVGDRIHGMVQYHGAHTGRDAGRLVQLQNLPARTETKATEETVDLIKRYSDAVSLLYPGLDFCSAHIRSCLIPSEGKTMYVGDYGQIEARVLAVMSGCDALLEGFSDPGRDLYVEFGDRHRLDRQGGKTGILGLGFQMGAQRFQQTMVDWGAGEISLEKAQEVVAGYRGDYPEVPVFWAALFRMYWNAVKLEGKVVTGPAGLAAAVVSGHLMVRLPSGRHLSYVAPRVEEKEKTWPSGDVSKVKVVTYMGIDSYTNQWTRKQLYGGLICENVVQATARDVMMSANIRLEMDGFETLFRVHDEIICEADAGREKKFIQTMEERPFWMPELPLEVEGGSVPRYGK